MKDLIDYFNSVNVSENGESLKKKRLLEELYFDIIISWNPLKQIQWSEPARVARDIKHIRDALENKMELDSLRLVSSKIKNDDRVKKALEEPANFELHRSILTDHVIRKYQYYIEVIMVADAISREYEKQRAAQALATVGAVLTIVLTVFGIYKAFFELLII